MSEDKTESYTLYILSTESTKGGKVPIDLESPVAEATGKYEPVHNLQG